MIKKIILGFALLQVVSGQYVIPAPGSSGGGGSGCVPSGLSGQILTDSGSGSCNSAAAFTYSGGIATLGTAGSVVGGIDLKNATSGTISIRPVTGALGTVTVTVPAITDTLVTLTATQTLTNKTLTTPTIGSFTNATHNHTNAAGGGTLTLAGAAFANQGTTTTLLHGNASGNPSFGQIVNGDITNATIDLTTKVTGILPTANGGTANAFFTVSGPATSAKTFTFPNASATVLTTNAAVTVSQGGTGATTLTGPIKGNGTSAFSAAAASDIYGLWSGTCSSSTFLRGDGSCQTPAGSGTVTVSGGGSLTSTAFMTGAGTTVSQTPSATSTLDSSGNAAFAGTVTGTAFISGSGPSVTAGTGGVDAWGEGTVPSVGAASGVDICYADSTAHRLKCSWNNGSYYGLPQVIASGTVSLGTSAVGSGTCSSAIDGGTATGVLTTDVILVTANADPVAITGYTPATTGTLYVWAYPTADHTNFKLCNNTSSSITPGSAVTLNWKVIR